MKVKIGSALYENVVKIKRDGTNLILSCVIINYNCSGIRCHSVKKIAVEQSKLEWISNDN